MNSKPDWIVIVAEDPGGGNLLAAYVLKHGLKSKCRFVLAGPAIRAFEALLGPVRLDSLDVLEMLPPESTLLLCATAVDHQSVTAAIHRARQLGIASVAYLDHWTNYAIRFGPSPGWRSNLPDEIWLTDQYAFRQAKREGFPIERLKVAGNPYLESVVNRIQLLRSGRRSTTTRILYVSEVLEEAPIPGGPTTDEYGYSGHSLLRDIAEAAAINNQHRFEIVVRLHPSEAKDKYASLIRELSPRILTAVSTNDDVAMDIASSDVVIGAQTTALVLAMEAGIPTLSYIPSGGVPCQLPHRELVRTTSLRELCERLAPLVAG